LGLGVWGWGFGGVGCMPEREERPLALPGACARAGFSVEGLNRVDFAAWRYSGDTTPCKMTGVTLHSHVHYKEISARTCSGPLISSVKPQSYSVRSHERASRQLALAPYTQNQNPKSKTLNRTP